MHALGIFRGQGAVALLDQHAESGAMLLERLLPGKAIIQLHDKQATDGAILVMGLLHGKVVPEDSFPTVAHWARGLNRLRATFGGGSGPFPNSLVEEAQGISNELLSSMDQPTLLHGDLHHWNILSAHRSPWLAIDPKGVVGEPAYEAGAWVRNPFPDLLKWSNVKRVIGRRIEQLSNALGVNRERIQGWSLYQAVLSAWWSFEDGDPNWEAWIEVAKLIK
jgi:streptomycin 6-kinase